MKILATAGYLKLFRDFKLARTYRLIDLQVGTKFKRSESVTCVTWHNE